VWQNQVVILLLPLVKNCDIMIEMANTKNLWFRLIEVLFWHIPRPFVKYEAVRMGRAIGTDIIVLGMRVARGGFDVRS